MHSAAFVWLKLVNIPVKKFSLQAKEIVSKSNNVRNIQPSRLWCMEKQCPLPRIDQNSQAYLTINLITNIRHACSNSKTFAPKPKTQKSHIRLWRYSIHRVIDISVDLATCIAAYEIYQYPQRLKCRWSLHSALDLHPST